MAAQGANTLIQPTFSTLFAKTSSGSYTNIDAAAYLVMKRASVDDVGSYLPNDAAIAAGSKTRLTDLLGTTTNSRTWLNGFYFDTEAVDGWGPVPQVFATTDGVNAALQIQIVNGSSGNLTGGNAANSLTVVVYYTIETVP